MTIARRLAPLLLLAFPLPAGAQAQTPPVADSHAQVASYLGLYEFDDGSFVDLSWLEEAGGIFMTDYPAGRIRILRSAGPGTFTAGPSAIAAEPVSLRFTIAGDRLELAENGRSRIARRAHFREEEVRFLSGDVHLAGTLTLPAGKGPFPAVVLLHGGGPQTRDFQWVTGFFARAGVAVLAYDKRGAGQSTGDWRGATALDLADDAIAGVELLRGRTDVDAGRIGLYGSSNGAWVAPVAAATTPGWINWVIARSAPSDPERLNVVYEVVGDLRNAGFGEDVVARVRDLHLRMIHASQNDGEGWASLRADLAASAAERWFGIARLPSELPELDDANRASLRAGWATQRAAFIDPLPYWHRLGCPVLVQTGSTDRNVPGPTATAAIRKAIADDRLADVRLYPNGDHGLFESPGGYMKDIATVTRFVPGYRQDLLAFVARYVTGPRAPRGKGCAPARR